MKRKRKGKVLLTIKHEMFLFGFLFFISVSLLFSGIFMKSLYDNSLNNARTVLRECSRQIVTYTEGMFHENATIIEILSRDDTVINAGKEDFSAVLPIYDAIQKRNDNITYIYAGYTDGRLFIQGYPTPEDYDATTRPWYRAAANAEGDDISRLVYRDTVTGEWLFSQCMKLVDSEGVMRGVIAIDCSNENISTQLSTKYQYVSQRSYIVDQEGLVLIHPNSGEINKSLRDRIDMDKWAALMDGRESYAEYLQNGVKAMAYLEQIPETDLIVVTTIDASEVTRPIIRNTVYVFFLIVVVSLMLGYILSRILIHRFAYPIMELSDRLQSLVAGQSGQTGELRISNAEVGKIAENIDILVRDIANHEKQRKAAEYLSFHDSMTGLRNRRFFEGELHRLDEKRNYPLSLLCCDINGLKLTNDVFGHAVGDKLILTVADCLKKYCREDDVLARTGGDEFVFILPRTSADEVSQRISRIKASFPKESVCGAFVSAALGFAVKTSKDQNTEEVLCAADEMMYERKFKESAEMKQHTVDNIIAAAKKEDLVRPLSGEEERLIDIFADALCPDSRELLKESYCIRKLGLCTLLLFNGDNPEALRNYHTESAYRILSALDNYRNMAGCILHYTEHWDGSGRPAGLSGRDIPLLSRIMAVTEAYFEGGITQVEENSAWYEPELIEILNFQKNFKKI